MPESIAATKDDGSIIHLTFLLGFEKLPKKDQVSRGYLGTGMVAEGDCWPESWKFPSRKPLGG